MPPPNGLGCRRMQHNAAETGTTSPPNPFTIKQMRFESRSGGGELGCSILQRLRN